MLKFIAKLGIHAYKKYNEASERSTKLKAMKAEGKFKIEEAKLNLKLARLESESKRIQKESELDATYDVMALRQKKHTYVDEFIAVSVFGMLFLTFIPQTQETMNRGWLALNNAPIWFSFIIIGIVISTFGLKGVYRDWVNKFNNPLKKKLKN